MTQTFIFSNRLAGFWIGVELFLDPNRGNCNGTWKTTKYFEANENSSVFTTANHLYFYDEEEDIEQIRQKIGIYKATVQGQLWQTVFFKLALRDRKCKLDFFGRWFLNREV
mgnify:CR=1 FL=1